VRGAGKDQMNNLTRSRGERPRVRGTRATRSSALGMRVLVPALTVTLALGFALLTPHTAGAAIQRTNNAQQSATSAQQADKSAQQSATPADAVSTLADILIAACRQDSAKFPDYLTAKNAIAFRQLSSQQQVALLRRLVLQQEAGRALLSTDANGRTVLRCDSPSFTVEIRLGIPRIEQNLAFVPVLIKPDRQIDFGLVMTSGGWKLLSIGVLMLDLQQLQPEWDAQEMADREDDAIKAMYKIAAAIDTYRNAFEKLPETLAQLGPAPKEGISPDAAGLLDAEIVSAHVGGYNFRYAIMPSGEQGKDSQFELSATPDAYGKSGKRSFFINGTGKLRGGDKNGAPATAADPVLEDASPSH
jgi:hypothetical protein